MISEHRVSVGFKNSALIMDLIMYNAKKAMIICSPHVKLEYINLVSDHSTDRWCNHIVFVPLTDQLLGGGGISCSSLSCRWSLMSHFSRHTLRGFTQTGRGKNKVSISSLSIHKKLSNYSPAKIMFSFFSVFKGIWTLSGKTKPQL